MSTPLGGDPTTRASQAGVFSTAAELLALQAPTSGAPRSSLMDTVTDPVLPPKTVAERMAHFYPDLYDVRPESALSRLVKALIGESGAGTLRRRYLAARMSAVLSTMRFGEMDRLYGQLLGLPRLSRELLDLSPYTDAATPEEWAVIDARDSAYRARILAFGRAIPMAGTAEGMSLLAEAVLGVECQVYESYQLLDAGLGVVVGASVATPRTYGDVEDDYGTYGALEAGTYSEAEGGSGTFGRTDTSNRGEFTIRPKRAISLEEAYALTKVLGRLKPAQALPTVDPSGVAVHSPAVVRAVSADSSYWEVRTKVVPKASVAAAYPGPAGVAATPVRPVNAGYQGEAWAYNSDVASTTAYVESATGARVSGMDYERIPAAGGRFLDLTPDRAMADPDAIARGRAASDGIIVDSPYDPARGTGVPV